MSGLDGPRQGFDELSSRTYLLWLAPEALIQAAASDELEDKVRSAFGLAHIVNLHNVGMLQAREGGSFCAQTCQVLRLGVKSAQNHLQRHNALKSDLPSPIDDPHAAAADFFDDFVARHH